MQRLDDCGANYDGRWMDLDVVVFMYFEGESLMKFSESGWLPSTLSALTNAVYIRVSYPDFEGWRERRDNVVSAEYLVHLESRPEDIKVRDNQCYGLFIYS